MARNEAGLSRALERDPATRGTSSGRTSRCPGPKNNLNKNLEYAGRVADYLEFAELLALDALHRTESCGGHFREESQTPDGEALRDDEHFSYVAAWQFGASAAADAARRAAGVRVREAEPAELQVAVSFQLASSSVRSLMHGWQSAESTALNGERVRQPMRTLQSEFQRKLEAGSERMRINLKVWRQPSPTKPGQLVPYTAENVLARHVVPGDA